MACSSVKEIPVLAHTNLGTRIVIAVSPEITVRDFKREFETAHLNCFRELGEIRVYGLKVKKKSCFYYLPESFPLKHVLQSLNDHFLHIEVCHLQHQSGSAESQEAEICDRISDFNDVPSTVEVQNFIATRKRNQNRPRRKKRRTKRIFCFKSLLSEFPRAVYFLKRKKNRHNKIRRNMAPKNPISGIHQGPHLSQDTVNHFASRADGKGGKELDVECPSETFSETISVSGIIKRYFTNYDEVTSSSRFSVLALRTMNKEHSMGEIGSDYRNREFDMSLPLTANTPPQMLHSGSLDQCNPKASKGPDKKSVGRRLVAASDNLGVYGSKQTPTLSLCKFRDGKPIVPNSTTRIKSLVFDMMDEDD